MTHPLDRHLEELEPATARTMEIFLSMIRGNVEPSRITPATEPREIRNTFEGTLGMGGTGLMAALEDFERLVLPQSLRISNPMYMGLVNSSPLPGAAH